MKKMKKALALSLALVMSATLFGCAPKENPAANSPTASDPAASTQSCLLYTSLYGIQGLSAGFFVSASRFLHVAGVLLVLLPSVLDHGTSDRQETGLRRWCSAGAPFR